MSNIAHLYVNGQPVSDANPVPTTAEGGGGGTTGDVNVTQLGGSAISQSAGVQNVALSGTPNVNVANTPSVNATLVGTPNVNVSQVGGSAVSQSAGVQNVAVANTVSVATHAVTISGTPAVTATLSGTSAVNVTQLAGSAISQSAGVQGINVAQLGAQAVSAQNSVAVSNLRGVHPLVVRDDLRTGIAGDTRNDVLRSDARGGVYTNCDLRYVNGLALATSDGNVPVTINNPTASGTNDNIDTPNNVLLAPLYAWNGVNRRFDRVRSVVTTFSAANKDFATTVDRHADIIVFGLTCTNSARLVKVYRIGLQVHQTNSSDTNCIALRYYKGIDTGSGSAIPLEITNHDNAFGGPYGENLGATAAPIMYPSGASGGDFTGGTLRAANTYVNGTRLQQEWDFGTTAPRQPLILRGNNNGIVLVNASDFGDSYVLTVWVEWTEELIDQAVP